MDLTAAVSWWDFGLQVSLFPGLSCNEKNKEKKRKGDVFV